MKVIHFGTAHGTLVVFEMARVLGPLGVGHRTGSIQAGLLLKFIRELGVLHICHATYRYGLSRFLRCIIPVRMRSFTVPSGCPRAVAISVRLIPRTSDISNGI